MAGQYVEHHVVGGPDPGFFGSHDPGGIDDLGGEWIYESYPQKVLQQDGEPEDYTSMGSHRIA